MHTTNLLRNPQCSLFIQPDDMPARILARATLIGKVCPHLIPAHGFGVNVPFSIYNAWMLLHTVRASVKNLTYGTHLYVTQTQSLSWIGS